MTPPAEDSATASVWPFAFSRAPISAPRTVSSLNSVLRPHQHRLDLLQRDRGVEELAAREAAQHHQLGRGLAHCAGQLLAADAHGDALALLRGEHLLHAVAGAHVEVLRV